MPARMASACAAGVSRTRTPAVAPSSTSAGIRAHRLAGAGQRDRLRQRRRSSHALSPLRSSPAAAVASSARSRGRSSSRSASRSRPAASTSPSAPSTWKRIRRWSGSRDEIPGLAAARGRRAASASARVTSSSSGDAPRLEPLEDLPDDLGHRDERPAQILGQAAQQRREQLAPQRGDQPLEPIGAHGAERAQRDVGGHAVVRRARLEAVAQLELERRPGATSPASRAAASPSAAAGSMSSSRV